MELNHENFMVQFVHFERKIKKKLSFSEEIKVCAVPSGARGKCTYFTCNKKKK